MPIVVDSWIAARWCLPDESSAIADLTLGLLRDTELLVPRLYWFEICNVLLVGERRKRINLDQVQRGLVQIDSLPTIVDDVCGEELLMMLARKHGLTADDAAYLEVASRRGLPLATLDRKLARAAEAESVPLISA
ncbi:type II toxin-antitoxin system VapC family toxin [Chelativorans sp.]|uniref:type II toxin-antitoxin system VapC family toxin n=1 Tax=Chelativorans sp. TaxID=2203393 RepID=UPI002811FD63|nr:type II toxin-antitoxin system VapC family toxin [Chelativorans sp.]